LSANSPVIFLFPSASPVPGREGNLVGTPPCRAGAVWFFPLDTPYYGKRGWYPGYSLQLFNHFFCNKN
jgi:hypothetical protein